MRQILLTAALLFADAAIAAEPAKPVPSPNEIVAGAPQADWIAIAPADLLVMDLAADAKGKPRRVVIQLMPPPFSQGWIGNIRRLAAAKWWDGTSINRVQDNYVVQWGDGQSEDKAKAKTLPPGLAEVPQSDYLTKFERRLIPDPILHGYYLRPGIAAPDRAAFDADAADGRATAFSSGWPVEVALDGRFRPIRIIGRNGKGKLAVDDAVEPVGFIDLEKGTIWPVHCYGMVGVGRNMPPDTGTGAELYTVIGHAPRHLDRNIALVGRVIEGIEHLSSLPRGTGALGFYETAEERVPIRAVRIGSEIADLPGYEYLSTESASFARYADARANRRDAFFIQPAGGADICNIPVPVRRVKVTKVTP